jgi:hypothetical protein
MSFPGVVSDQPACVVAAESATHAFIDHAFVLKQGLRECGASGSASVPGQKSAAGQKSVPVSSGSAAEGQVLGFDSADQDVPCSHAYSYSACSLGSECWVTECCDTPVLPPQLALPFRSFTLMQF